MCVVEIEQNDIGIIGLFHVRRWHIEAETKLPPIRRRIRSFGSYNGLASTKLQAIIWSNDGMFPAYIYASRGPDELSQYLKHRWPAMQ